MRILVILFFLLVSIIPIHATEKEVFITTIEAGVYYSPENIRYNFFARTPNKLLSKSTGKAKYLGEGKNYYIIELQEGNKSTPFYIAKYDAYLLYPSDTFIGKIQKIHLDIDGFMDLKIHQILFWSIIIISLMYWLFHAWAGIKTMRVFLVIYLFLFFILAGIYGYLLYYEAAPLWFLKVHLKYNLSFWSCIGTLFSSLLALFVFISLRSANKFFIYEIDDYGRDSGFEGIHGFMAKCTIVLALIPGLIEFFFFDSQGAIEFTSFKDLMMSSIMLNNGWLLFTYALSILLYGILWILMTILITAIIVGGFNQRKIAYLFLPITYMFTYILFNLFTYYVGLIALILLIVTIFSNHTRIGDKEYHVTGTDGKDYYRDYYKRDPDAVSINGKRYSRNNYSG